MPSLQLQAKTMKIQNAGQQQKLLGYGQDHPGHSGQMLGNYVHNGCCVFAAGKARAQLMLGYKIFEPHCYIY